MMSSLMPVRMSGDKGQTEVVLRSSIRDEITRSRHSLRGVFKQCASRECVFSTGQIVRAVLAVGASDSSCAPTFQVFGISRQPSDSGHHVGKTEHRRADDKSDQSLNWNLSSRLQCGTESAMLGGRIANTRPHAGAYYLVKSGTSKSARPEILPSILGRNCGFCRPSATSYTPFRT